MNLLKIVFFFKIFIFGAEEVLAVYKPPKFYCTNKLGNCKPNNRPYCCGENLTVSDEPDSLGIREQFILTANFKKEIVKFHNDIRNLMAEGNLLMGNGNKFFPGSRIHKIVYDDELEFSVAHWLRRCINESDICRSSPGFQRPGQNLGWIPGTVDEAKIMAILESWTDQRKLMKEKHPPTLEPNDPFHNYIQMMYSEVNHMGCAAYSCTNLNNVTSSLFGCNYNIEIKVGEPAYVVTDTNGAKCDSTSDIYLCDTKETWKYTDQVPTVRPPCFKDHIYEKKKSCSPTTFRALHLVFSYILIVVSLM